LKILQFSQAFKGIWKVVAKEAQKQISARELFLSRQGHSQQADNACAVSTTVPSPSQVIKDCNPDMLSCRPTGQSASIYTPGDWTAEHNTAQRHSACQPAYKNCVEWVSKDGREKAQWHTFPSLLWASWQTD